jgi:hypothetical protein
MGEAEVRHPTDEQWLEIARGGEVPDAAGHAESCALCAGRLEAWRQIVTGLLELEAAAIDDGERHLLATMTRVRTPRRPLRLADLLRTTAAAPAHVRGVQARLWEYVAGTTRVTLQARDEGGRVALVGQVTEGDLPWPGGRLAVSGEDGPRQETEVDACGEFALALTPGRYRLEVEGDQAGVVIPLVDLDPECER